jgi:hypothetical protein
MSGTSRTPKVGMSMAAVTTHNPRLIQPMATAKGPASAAPIGVNMNDPRES